MRLAAAVTVLAGLAAAAHAQTPTKTAPLKDAAGREIGRVVLTPAPKGVLMRIEASGLAPGWHAIHVHEKGSCGEAFKAAGGHVHAGAAPIHGLLNPQANDGGDLPNIFVAGDGTAKAELFSPLVALGEAPGRANLLDADGASIVIHAKPDDYRTQPIGGAGDRVACGVVG